MNNFQTILSAVFLALFVFAVLIFSGLIKIGDSSSSTGTLKGKVVIWGTLSSPEFYKVFEEAVGTNNDLTIKYVKNDPLKYQQSIIEAMASDKGPDMFIITPDMIIKNDSYIYKMPYAGYPEKTFRDSFIDGAEIYLDTDGIIGFPLVVDPMVMYYNKNLLTNEGIASPPVYWGDLFNLNNLLTKKEDDGTILTSMVALGRYDNVSNPKGVFSTLLLQSDNPIVKKVEGKYVPFLTDNSSRLVKAPVEAVLNFLMEFSNPANLAYSWNRSLPNSIDMFTDGKLAFYFGKASELFRIQSTNPNLSFDVVTILQTKNAIKRTYGDIYALAINKKSTNSGLSFGVAGLLSSGDPAKNFSEALSLPPASKILLSEKPEDPYKYAFYNSAIFTRSWADPNPVASQSIFNELFDNVLSNKLEVEAAISRAQSQFEQIIK